ncbi:PREDICTED: radial spoke head 14 homolog [Nicrophorus vespilloides]|uniref:Radial spoke head 14 homolog n=1 Tax=Nicrophorus vespilloides TaxID=110193 RepID=A0ABM1MVH0_NICVS|nr:PREDICTED: radial spoke head 14 homolog [Nicrophorus vespilloides]
MFPVHKHSYLQCVTKIDPRIINRTVDLARDNYTIDQFDTLPPFNRLCSEQPNIPVCSCDVTRRPVGFGRWGMKKLRRELHSTNRWTVMQAIHSIGDLVYDPERNFEAIRLRVPARFSDLVIDEDPAVRERVCMVLATISNLLDGKYSILKNHRMINNLARILNDEEPAVRMKVIVLIEKLSKVWMCADILVNNGFVEMIIERLDQYIEDDPCTPYYLRTMQWLMYCTGKYIAIERGFHKTLTTILYNDTNCEVLAEALKCMAMLISTPRGKCFAIEGNLLIKLYNLLHDQRREIYSAAAGCMVFATIKTEAILKAIELPNLIERLLILARSHHDLTTQIHCIQVITNLCGHGKVRKYVLETYSDKIRSIYTQHDEQAERFKHNLLTLQF